MTKHDDNMARAFDRLYHDSRFDWPAYARAYEKSCRDPSGYYARSAEAIVSALKLEPRANVLDLACGTGVATRKLLEQYPEMRVTGIDLSEASLEHYKTAFVARIERRQVHVLQGNAEKLDSFVKGPFNVIVCASALWNFKWQKTLKNIQEHLTPGGSFAFNVPALYLGEDGGILEVIENAFHKYTNRTDLGLPRLSRSTIENALKTENLRVDCAIPYTFNLGKDQVESFLEVLSYRTPLIFFPTEKGINEAKIASEQVLDGILNTTPETGHFEHGLVFIVKRI